MGNMIDLFEAVDPQKPINLAFTLLNGDEYTHSVFHAELEGVLKTLQARQVPAKSGGSNNMGEQRAVFELNEERAELIDIFSERALEDYDSATCYMESEYPILWKTHREYVQQYFDFEIAEKTASPFRGQ